MSRCTVMKSGYEDWYPVYGFEGIYEVSPWGDIRRVWKTRNPTTLKGYHRKHRKHGKTVFVKLCMGKKGMHRVVKLSHVVYSSIKGPIPGRMSVVHKNGDHMDNSINNLVLMSNQELGKITGAKSSRVPCVKIDGSGNVIEAYTSAREAGRKNYMSYQTVMDRCNRRVKNEFALTGYTFRWDR